DQRAVMLACQETQALHQGNGQDKGHIFAGRVSLFHTMIIPYLCKVRKGRDGNACQMLSILLKNVADTCEDVAGGTKFTTQFDMQTEGLFSLADPLMAHTIKRSVESGLATLKDLLESRARAASA